MINGILGQYINGNARVTILTNGTKIREIDGDTYEPAFPESMDVKICNRCNNGCSFCYANSTPDGKLGCLKWEFFKTLNPYTEIAVGGGNPLEHPALTSFLFELRNLGLIPNLTVHQNHFLGQYDYVKSLMDRELVFGVGVSVQHVTDELIEKLSTSANFVVHVIAGVMPIHELRKLYNHNIKLLVLGYKDLGRGKLETQAHAMSVGNEIEKFENELRANMDKFTVVSFDNLAIRQLHVQSWMTPEQWERFYLGDDGTCSMYVDLVRGEFASSSVSETYYPITDNIRQMFQVVKEEKAE